MRLSVIIVNYNVRYFLEQCLFSVQKASCGVNTEVIVIDNQSKDGSLEYLQPKFPEVKFISKTINSGFAKACNEGLAKASGEFVLFLNPDTLLPEDCFQKCLQFFEMHPECGALGVQMIDGSGCFLKESKRSFPSPVTSLFKLFGLATLFPKSKLFSRYYLGHLDKDKDCEADVLAGAFMMVRKKVLDAVGAFDERFFMYGEDVDLSYRIQKGGYRNYYFAGTTIIHFKGESTKRGSLNYVKMFYKAMSVFVQKHYGGTRAGIFNASIQVAIWTRAAIAAVGKVLKWIGLPVADVLLILFSFWLAKELGHAIFSMDLVLSKQMFFTSFSLFALSYFLVSYYAALYEKFYRTAKLAWSIALATVVSLVVYAFLPKGFYSAIGVLLCSSLIAFVLLAGPRMLLTRAGLIKEPAEKISKPYIVVAGAEDEFQKLKELLRQKGLEQKIAEHIIVNEHEKDFTPKLREAKERMQQLKKAEIIFCAGGLSYKKIIEGTKELKKFRVRFFAGNSIIGSDDSSAKGEALSTEKEYELANPANRRQKRLIDILFSVLSLLTFPLQFLLVKKPLSFLNNCLLVLGSKQTWVGYALSSEGLPGLKRAVLAPDGTPAAAHKVNTNLSEVADERYARTYRPLQDLIIILKNYRYLGG